MAHPAARPGPSGAAGGRGERLAGLDLLRLIAALAVMAFHYGYRGTAGVPMSHVGFPEIAGVAMYGFLGVDLFFVISGFVIAASAEGRSAAQFAVARAGRLYPAFIVCMSVTALLVALLGMAPHKATLPQWIANLTMLAPAFGQPFMDGAYWSIVLEIVFYAWVAILIATGLYRTHLTAIIAVWLAVCVAAELLIAQMPLLRPLRLVLLTEYGALFASGMLIHEIWRGRATLANWWLLGAAFVAGSLHLVQVERGFAALYGETLAGGVLLALHGAIYVLFIGALWLSRRLKSGPFILACGGLTYPLYLLHQVAGYVLLSRLEPVAGRWGALVLTVGIMIGLAYLVWRHVEPPGRRLLLATVNRLAVVMQSARAQRA